MSRRWWVVALVVVVALAVLAGRTLTAPGRSNQTPSGGSGEQPMGVATATSAAAPIGVSARSDWYEIYTTNPRYPDDPQRHHGGIDEKLVGLMDRAQRTLDVADYDFDLAGVAEAMVRAKQRGAQVRMVTDSDTLDNTKDKAIQDAFAKLKAAGIPVVEDGRPAIMHDKFTVADGEYVSTGSWNYTDGDTYRLNNWMGIFHSNDLAANYSAEFAQMFEQQRFGPSKANLLPHPSIIIDGAEVTTCFSPPGHCADLIVDTVNREAKQSVHFMAFSFTHDGIGKAISDKAKAGVRVVGVFETTGSQTQFSEYGKMKQAGLEVYLDGNPYSMHHKVIVVDGHITIAGSFNFSNNADKDNDENLLIIDDQQVAQAFDAEFQRVLAVAKNPPEKR